MISSSKTSSTILYKFRSSNNFESVELPGTSARLFDIKRAIVKAKKLDSGQQIDFELSVKNASTEEEYTDESSLLPRGTRLVIGRLPAGKGQGLLAKIARAEAGMSSVGGGNVNTFSTPSGYFTIQSRAGDEDELVDSVYPANPAVENQKVPLPQAAVAAVASSSVDADSEEKELAALKAVTDQAASIYRPHTTLNRGLVPNKFGIPPPPPPPALAGGAPPRQPMNTYSTFIPPIAHSRSNASNNIKFMTTDPELKEYESKQNQVKKRATGIPRTFLMSGAESNATSTSDPGTEGDTAASIIRLQPNTIGFEALIQRGGGQSESGTAQTRSFEYALKLTATKIPEHLQCGICQGVVKNAMLVPWDTQGRAVCELCMRDNLAKNGFRCPLTGMEGVSPDDLYPNHGLRKVADLFVQEVMELMDKVVLKQQADEEAEQQREKEALFAAAPSKDLKKTIDDLDLDDNSPAAKKNKALSMQSKRKRQDPFDFDADFGGDVFDVSKDEKSLDDEMQQSSLMRPDPPVNLNRVDEERALDSDKINGIISLSDNAESKLEGDKNISCAIANGESVTVGTQRVLNTEENIIANKQSSLDTEVDPSPNSKDESSYNQALGTTDVIPLIDGSESTLDSSHIENKLSTASVQAIDRKELVKSRGPPPGYKIGPAGGVAVHGKFPPTSPAPIIKLPGSVQASPTLTKGIIHNQLRGDGNPMNGRDGFRGRGGRGRGRNFRGGYSNPLTPQVRAMNCL